MNYRNLCNVFLLLVLCYKGNALPAVETAIVPSGVNTIEESDKLPDSNSEQINAAASQEAGLVGGNATNPSTTAESEAVDPTLTGDNEASASNNEPVSIYAGGLITPEAFQQYLNQYGGAAGLAPLGTAYPAPITGPPGLYPFPGPIVVQTGYEGFLVPASPAGSSNSESAADATTTVALTPVAAPSASPTLNPLMAFASRLLPTILMSTLFRIAAVVLSAVGVILFGGAITNALCRLTPICDISGKAVTYFRTGGAQNVGRMLAEEITPERVRRTAEFVRGAIEKYRQLQKLVDPDSST
ncbi:uncharacterized protein LOC117576246 [Drosophila albomicans]|uniref:Uncharacterized protein LOC117576246 n=1 Tax=Drosophila albomicans TaxID=7291 RepID=A0A6P8XTS0_DROAB|nr:uncharacterized protein LOC117576246 [Drosophila albomicans]